MSSPSAGSTASEMIFVELFQTLSASEDRLGVLADFIRRFPDREAELRELAGFNSALDDSRTVSPPPPLPAQLGEFRIGRLLKLGGMGEIYEAFHDRLDRRVALKVIRRGWTTSYARERFAREQYVLAKLHHSHIVPIQTGGEDGPIQYFTMPFIHGSALNHVVDTVASLSSSMPSMRTPSVPEIVSQVLQKSEPKFSSGSSTNAKLPLESDGTKTLLESNERLRLSRSYFISVARTMADVADAIEYAHQAGVLHRDLKPANVMIESNGHCWVIDFGLAARLVTGENESSVSRIGETLFGSLTSELGGGTYNYMAPERWQGKPADERSDVFSLGAMLYELLALRQAYSGMVSTEIKNKILNGTRIPAVRIVNNLPDDLAAIADKAMHLDPALRYQCAAEFAEDLRRWLRFEPILARPAMPWKRFSLWTRRKPVLAAALMFALIASTCTAAAVVDSYKSQTRVAQAETQVAKAENRIATIQLQRDRFQQGLLGEHVAGWSDTGWDSVRKLVQEESGRELKSLAAATRVGVDARSINQWDYSPSYLAYNPDGTKLLMVKFMAADEQKNSARAEPRHAQIWDSVTHQLQSLPQPAHDSAGPVNFRNDNEPLQLVWNRTDASAILLWNLATQVSVGRMECPFPLEEGPLSWSIIPDGSIASALVRHAEDTQLFVWETATGKLIAKINATASVAALSPDGALVAMACSNGVVEIWSVARGERVASLSENHADILCFAWTKDRLRPIDSSEPGWLLAAGAFGGDLTIWDVGRESARSHCIGSSFEVFALSFSPDGMTLASAGRGAPILWDIATGGLVLKTEFANTLTSIAYSPKGDSLAIGSRRAWGSPGITGVYEIQEKRGQQVLRGLRSRVTRVRVSESNRYIAALSDNWQLAIWDLKAHSLLHVFQIPIGVYAESAGLAIDPEERRIAVVAGSQARIWDINSGSLIKSIDLPRGFLDSVVFQDSNTLISARQESVNSEFAPAGPNTRPDLNPRVCRIRNLLGPEPQKPFLTIPDFKRSAVSITLTPSAKHVLIDGYYQGGEVPERRLVKLFDLPAGTQRWEQDTDSEGANFNRVQTIDPTGRILEITRQGMKNFCELVDLETGIPIRPVKNFLKAIGPNDSMNIVALSDPDLPEKSLLSIVQGDDDNEVLRLGILKPPADGVTISKNAQYFIYGCYDGSVVVTDLWSVQRKLAEVGLH